MDRTDQAGERDRRRTLVRRITAWTAAASLATAAGVAGLLGVAQNDNTTSTTGTVDTGSGTSYNKGPQSADSVPEASGGQSTVTSGGS